MFDTVKIQKMTALLEKIPEQFDNVYVTHEGIFTAEVVALFRRLKIPIRAIMSDTMAEKELFGIPAIDTAEATFTERTALIIVTKKPVPIIQTTFNIKITGGVWTIPAFVMSIEEITPIYDRVMVEKLIQMYEADDIDEPKNSLYELAERFARGFVTRLQSPFQNFQFRAWESRQYFKPTYIFNDTAIVIQGPLVYDNNYTAETFKLYRSIYPNVPIVISTWRGEATNDFRRECLENSIVLLENDMPEERTYGNINLQIKSSFEGVKYIKENTSAKFVLKTRSDQRIDLFAFLVYFKNLLETFPPKGDKLNQRIILFGSETTKQFPFNFHDFLAFGHISDISRLYDIPLKDVNIKLRYKFRHIKRVEKISNLVVSNKSSFDYNAVSEQSHKLFKLNRAMNRIYWPEVYLMRTFYEKYIAPVDVSKLFETSWKFTADYLILIDFETVHLDWSKYESMRYHQNFAYISQCAFARWLDMYRNFKIDWV